MTDNNKDIDQITSGWLKKLPLDEPSENFSKNVMHSVFALEKKKPDDNINYWWFLLLLPVLVAGGWWFLWPAPEFMEKIRNSWIAVREFYFSLNSGFGEAFGRMKEITISPVIILIFLAILTLLLMEDIFRKSRHKVSADA